MPTISRPPKSTSRSLCSLTFAAAIIGVFVAGSSTVNSAEVNFQRDILPLLREHCIDCHGPDEAKSKLRLDSPLNALRGGNSGERVIFPGNSAQSYLIERITSKVPKKRMPPDADALQDSQVKLLRSWIDGATHWKPVQTELASQKTDHWSFQPLTRPSVPEPDAAKPVDAFIRAELKNAGLTMSNTAPRRRLIRRLYLVMHGMPPTTEQVQRFLNDRRENAWKLLVDQVLDSPRYGERLAMHWLDLVRFGETHGFETNRERPNAWHYRDWVIQALNDDKPYDQFIIEQIAGDAIGADAATGFLVAGPYDLVKGQDKQLRVMQRQDELADMINTTGTAFMGLTLGCARCHNHKFDPVSQTDYYSMQAIFAGVNHADRAMPLPAKSKEQLVTVEHEISELKESLVRFIRRPGFAHLLIDDSDKADQTSVGIEYLVEPAGTGTNPQGSGPGFASDPGSDTRAANISQGRYTWWKNEPGRDVAAYRPFTSGRFRIWLSWGAGIHAHSTASRFLLDVDGDIKSAADRKSLAVVNQQMFADGTGDVPGKPLWSGFYNAGVHELNSRHAIVVQGGETGTAITADVLLLEPIRDNKAAESNPAKPSIRSAVNATHNVEQFPAVAARFVRFTINASSVSQPCIDELEVFAGDDNVGLASAGAKPSSSGDFVHPLHKLEHINDGKYGNARSWISAQPSGGWVQIELPATKQIDSIEWARDREGRYADRLAVDYQIDVSIDGKNWRTVAGSADRIPFQATSPAQVKYDFASFPAKESADGREQLARLNALIKKKDELSKPKMVYAGTFSQPGPTHRLYRGEPSSPREEVVPAAIRTLTDLVLSKESPEQQRRLAVAKWMAGKDNPLTSRVMVNRIWQYHFGAGIVDTPSDFGGNGTEPTHPKLLDWLAAEFIDSGWSIKHMHRLVLMSDTWQQDSRPRNQGLAIDAGSRLLWRFPPRRLEAEGIRDCILAVTGKLDLRMGGPGFSAFEIQPENVRHYFPKKSYGPEDWRRMIYMTKVRQERDSVFGIFDCPDCSQVVPKRSRSTTPLQALNLLNSPFVMQQADFFVKRLEGEARTANERVVRAYELCFARPPDVDEIESAVEFIRSTNWHQFGRAMLNANEFVFIP